MQAAVFRVALAALVLAVVSACSNHPKGSTPGSGETPLFEGLGSHSRPVTTPSKDAQEYFDQGLNFVYGFNHDEAIRSFRRAAALDPSCAMAWWGIAYANGPHINKPFVDEAGAKAAWEALAKARSAAGHAGAIEAALIDALSKRYADPQPADRRPLDEAYAAAMRSVWQRYPDDADVGALFAESLMDLRPWDLWTQDGKAQPGTDEILETLETVIERSPKHPLANHLYIHAVEASPHPEKADAAADRLRGLQPGLGHMVHMPSHIDVRRGRWKEAITANEKAIEADRRYREVSPSQDFYRVYMAHNGHMLTYAAMMEGEGGRAMTMMRETVEGIPADWARESAAFVDGFMAMPMEVAMRFGRWEQVLAEPEFPEYFPIARAMRRYARATAFAATGRLEQARAEQALFLESKQAVPAEAFFGNNSGADLLAVAEHMMAGEILFRSGKADEGIEELREAVSREDALRYDEPPDWIIPVRHALGAVLLQAGRYAEAEAVYREDLAKLPENGWALFGLGRSLRLQSKDVEAEKAEERFRHTWSRADGKLSSSCFCQPGV
jgi:tetratricopeptide (TPR) repeat protein